MFYGLGSAPAAFQKMMENILSGLQGAQCYLDDVIVYGSSQADHEGLEPNDSHVKAILNAPAPVDAASLRSVLGLSAWYSKFMPNYASIVEPIGALL